MSSEPVNLVEYARIRLASVQYRETTTGKTSSLVGLVHYHDGNGKRRRKLSASSGNDLSSQPLCLSSLFDLLPCDREEEEDIVLRRRCLLLLSLLISRRCLSVCHRREDDVATFHWFHPRCSNTEGLFAANSIAGFPPFVSSTIIDLHRFV